MHNRQNSKPREGFGQHNNYECPHCGDKKRFAKPPYLVECGRCKKMIKFNDLIKLDEGSNTQQ